MPKRKNKNDKNSGSGSESRSSKRRFTDEGDFYTFLKIVTEPDPPTDPDEPLEEPEGEPEGEPEEEPEEVEYVVIKRKVETIDDLIEIGKLYDPMKEYNIDVKILHQLIEPLTELKNMIGMNSIKQDMVDHILFSVQHFENYHQMMMHTVIEGPPGTGKTEVAQIIGKIYLAMGILRNKAFVKATRSQLIAGYLGQTAIATQKMIDRAAGGILFIDEVYSLGNADKKDSFSKECIDTLNENLTLRKTDFICIIAGYKEDIKNCFFAYNAGLERRFPIRFRIEEYNAAELFAIFIKKIQENKWTMDDSITVKFFTTHHADFKSFGGDIELLYNSCKRAHSRRVFETGDTRRLLRINDLSKGFESFIHHQRKKETEESDAFWHNMFN